MHKDSTLARLEIHDALVAALGSENVCTDPDIADAQAGDWSDTERQAPSLVLFPRTPAQVASALGVLNKFGQRAVVQGGLTGLAGAATPQKGEVALSLAKLNKVEEFDLIGGTVTVQAGVTLENLQDQVEAAGWLFPLDLGARGTCQIGGNAATNAGGNRVVRYGTMRELVLGIEVALANGTLLTMLNRVTKNTTGIDLKQLFIGSEGTLGVITRVVLKLSPKPSSAVTALCALSSFDDAAVLVKEMRRHLPTLSAFELMWEDFMDGAIGIMNMKPPFAVRYPVYVLVELLGTSDEEDRNALQRFLERALEAETVKDAIVAQSLEHARQLWEYRESIGELLSKLKPHAAFDVGIPTELMDGFVSTIRTTLKQRFPEQRHLFFGHLGDGNLHVLSGPYAKAEELHEVEEVVYAAVGDAGGSISAEHGIGVVKKEYLRFSRSKEEIALMQGIKALLDPNNVLNSGRVFEAIVP